MKEDESIRRNKAVLLGILISVVLLFGTLAAVYAVNTLHDPSPVSSAAQSAAQSAALRVVFFDVGQGDAILVILPNQKTILVDAGEAKYGEFLESELRNIGIARLDAVVATHPHADHIGAMSHMIDRFDVGSVYMTKASTTTKTFENLLLSIAEKGLKVHTAKAGVTIDLDQTADVRIISPISLFNDSLNNHSVVVYLHYSGISFLLTGDAEIPAETQILASEQTLHATILKVGHHGSKSSTGSDFLAALRPQIAVISVGRDNRYGHPSAEVLQRLEQHRVKVYTTEQHGTIEITAAENTYTVHTEKRGS